MNAAIAHWVTVKAQKLQDAKERRRVVTKLKQKIRQAALEGYNQIGVRADEDIEHATIMWWTERNGYKCRKDGAIYWITW